MFSKRINLISVLCCLLSALPVSAEYRPIEVEKGGTIRGIVVFPYEPPARGMFGTRGDEQCPRGIPQEHMLVKQETLGLKNVLVILDIQKGKPLPLVNVRLDNKECRFTPRVLWAPKSGNLLMGNNDPTSHFVQGFRQDVIAFSVQVASGSAIVRRPLVTAGLHKINCGRHLWERAWLYVSDHPYVAVTDAGGRFEFKDVPPGTYTIKAWHEGWKEKGTESTGQLKFHSMGQTLRVKVKKDEVSEVRLDGLGLKFESELGI